jgi:hypothetical protein
MLNHLVFARHQPSSDNGQEDTIEGAVGSAILPCEIPKPSDARQKPSIPGGKGK